MKTNSVGFFYRFSNYFSAKGRAKNSIINRLEKEGYTDIKIRDLKDTSSVILGYVSPNEKIAKRAFKIIIISKRIIVACFFSINYIIKGCIKDFWQTN